MKNVVMLTYSMRPVVLSGTQFEVRTMEAEERKRIVREVFGDSSSSDEEQQQQRRRQQFPAIAAFNGGNSSATVNDCHYIWERIKEINGLWLCPEFLPPERQSSLLRAIDDEGWFTEGFHNQAHRFGDLPAWAIKLSSCIREAAYFSKYVSECGDMESWDLNNEESCPLPSKLLWREPFFDQLIAHVYQPGEGICAHVDLMRFEDGIAIVSLESTCVMHFSPVENETCRIRDVEIHNKLAPMKIPILLNPGSLILMHEDARYLWKHEINRDPRFQVWGGQELCQKRRTSITLRKLCPQV
ncbi:hypothetical protein Scep_018827 [Stephania cephalantha]|uniref:Alpha-ketoglutarate-dependent dioxygenase AlkB-like domain-containing protein n=1 Tax=Stephania cephalantha TaxID=152367 RepID=A0AAP0NLK5_9MAGN